MADTFDPNQYLAEKTQPVAQQGLRIQTNTEPAAAFDPNQYLAEKTQAKPSVIEPDPKFYDKRDLDLQKIRGKDSLDGLMHGAGMVADYPGGLMRTGLAGFASNISGHHNFVTEDDLKKASLGMAPTTDQYLERAGVPEGKFSPGGEGNPFVPDVSLRKVAGFAGDVLSDPLSLVAKAERPLGELVEKGGEKVYKSGLKKIDERLVEKGKTPLSDIMLQEGAPVGTTKTIAKKADELAAGLATERKQLYKQASDKGVTVDLGYPLERSEALLGKMRENPGMRDLADQLEEKMLAYKKEGKVPVDKLSDWKSAFYDTLPAGAFGPDGKVRGPAKQFAEAMSQDFKDAIQQAGNKAEKGLGDKIADINDRWSSLLEARKPLDMQVRRGTTKNAITPVDAIIGALHPGAEVLKKAVDLGNLTAVRTGAGKGLMKAGQSGLLDLAAQRGLINKTKKKGLIEDKQGAPSVEQRIGSDE